MITKDTPNSGEIIYPEQNKPTCFMETIVGELTELQKHAKLEARKHFFYDTRSENIGHLTKALTEFILALPQLKTDKSAMGRYNYQSLTAMLESINPVLAKFGCKCFQPPHTIGDTTYVVTTITHISGQYFRCVTAIPKEYTVGGKVVNTSQNLQALGGAQTYIKRYALKSMLGIDADDDTDGNGIGQQSSVAPNAQVNRTSYGTAIRDGK